MKPNNLAVADVESTMMGEEIDYGIDPKSLAHLMALLSSVYKNPAKAIPREYIANAIDSHREARNCRPVAVTLPNVFNSTLVIQDWGIGLDLQDIRETFVFYGASTKRDSDLTNGMMGIGAKSAFAYSNAFTVEAVKDGVRTFVSVSVKSDGKPSARIVDQSATDDPNGVTISIPVSDIEEMNGAVREYAKYLPANTVLVDGEDLSERHLWRLMASDIADDDGRVVVKNIWTIPVNDVGADQSRIIMGHVAYEPFTDISPDSDVRYAVIAEVIMGSVVFAPNREELANVALTLRTENMVIDGVNKILFDSIAEEIAEAPTGWDAVRAFHKHYRVLNNLDPNRAKALAYKGVNLPAPIAAALDTHPRLLARIHTLGNSRDARQCTSISYSDFMHEWSIFVTGAPDKALTPTMKKKIEQYCADNDLLQVSGSRYYYGRKNVYLFMAESLDDKGGWLKDVPTVDWADIQKVVLPRNIAGTVNPIKGRYHVIDENGDDDLRGLGDDEKIVAVVGRQLKDNYQLCRWAGHNPMLNDDYRDLRGEIVDLLEDDEILVDVYANRIDKLLRDYPNSRLLTSSEVSARLKAQLLASITDADIDAWGRYQTLQRGSNLMNKIQNYVPEADDIRQTLLGEEEDNSVSAGRVNRVRSIWADDAAFMNKCVAAEKKYADMKGALMDRYPLLNSGYGLHNIGDTHLKRYFYADWQIHINSQEEDYAV